MKKFYLIFLVVVLVGVVVALIVTKTPKMNSSESESSGANLRSELEKTYNEFREAVLSGDVETAVKIMSTPLNDGKTLAERPRESLVTQSFIDLFPSLKETNFLKIVNIEGSEYYIRTQNFGGGSVIGINKFTKVNGEWTISVTYINFGSTDFEVTEANITQALEKAVAALR